MLAQRTQAGSLPCFLRRGSRVALFHPARLAPLGPEVCQVGNCFLQLEQRPEGRVQKSLQVEAAVRSGLILG